MGSSKFQSKFLYLRLLVLCGDIFHGKNNLKVLQGVRESLKVLTDGEKTERIYDERAGIKYIWY